MTFSIVAHCELTGQFGVAVTSSSVCVASRCAWTRAGVGAVATQNLTDPALGPMGLDLLMRDQTASQVVAMLVAGDPGQAYRQLQVIDSRGRVAQHTGASALPTVASAIGSGCAAAGNLLANDGVPQAMVDAFAEASGCSLSERLILALQAGLRQGGETRGLRSAGIQGSDCQSWPVVGLRIDDQSEPLDALASLWKVYEPLLPGYVSRAAAPDRAVV